MNGTSGVWPPEPTGAWVIDLDGVLWLSGKAIPGSPEAISILRDAGRRVIFATNNSAPTVAELAERLGNIGIPADPSEMVTSAMAAALLIPVGSRAIVVGEAGIREALRTREVTVVEDPRDVQVDVVVVGWTRKFTFEALTRATTAIRNGALLVGTNEDPSYPTPEGLLPGAGSLLAAVAVASDCTPEVAGKPHQGMADLIAKVGGELGVVVGDRPSTDGLLARRLGTAFALVLSGVTTEAAAEADVVAEDLRTLVTSVI